MPNIHLFKVAAPAVARKAQAGQFVVIRIDERGERIPLTIADWDRDEGTITIVFMEVGTTTARLALLKAGDAITDFVGPLGVPTHVEKFGTVICAARPTERVPPGTVHSYESSAVYDPVGQPGNSADRGGCMNQLTPSRMMIEKSHSHAANSCLVQVAPWKGEKK